MINGKIKPEIEKKKPSWRENLEELTKIQSERISVNSEMIKITNDRIKILNERVDNIIEYFNKKTGG